MNIEDTQNHRTRVAAQRREKTRAKLLESALLVFAKKGLHAVIDDVIAQAGVARGSFYNYFRTNEELMEAVAGELNNELLLAIDNVVRSYEDPAERIACGTRLLLHAVMRFPLYGTFMARLPYPAANTGFLGSLYLQRDVALGVEAHRFKNIDQKVGTDLLAGVVLSAAYAGTREALNPEYPGASAQAMLRALGLENQEAERLSSLPLPSFELPADSLLRRTNLLDC
ncbi:MAG: TetR/AcrR family transcriptional regulator [Burkholderiaceae bacterium]|nr:TetR/AcrR family transcriptional regulator [Burkholderiaceae bacterium]